MLVASPPPRIEVIVPGFGGDATRASVLNGNLRRLESDAVGDTDAAQWSARSFVWTRCTIYMYKPEEELPLSTIERLLTDARPRCDLRRQRGFWLHHIRALDPLPVSDFVFVQCSFRQGFHLGIFTSSLHIRNK